MAQRDSDGAEQVFGRDAVGIPFADAVFGIAQFVGLSVGECPFFVMPFDAHLAFRFNAVDGLVMKYTSVILEKCAVLAADVHQHGREAVRATSPFAEAASAVP